MYYGDNILNTSTRKISIISYELVEEKLLPTNSKVENWEIICKDYNTDSIFLLKCSHSLFKQLDKQNHNSVKIYRNRIISIK